MTLPICRRRLKDLADDAADLPPAPKDLAGDAADPPRAPKVWTVTLPICRRRPEEFARLPRDLDRPPWDVERSPVLPEAGRMSSLARRGLVRSALWK